MAGRQARKKTETEPLSLGWRMLFKKKKVFVVNRRMDTHTHTEGMCKSHGKVFTKAAGSAVCPPAFGNRENRKIIIHSTCAKASYVQAPDDEK